LTLKTQESQYFCLVLISFFRNWQVATSVIPRKWNNLEEPASLSFNQLYYFLVHIGNAQGPKGAHLIAGFEMLSILTN
jgi:hypothetical protein